MARAAQLGLNVAKPHGESSSFDAIVEGTAGLYRVQIKSTAARQGNSYSCNCSCGTYHPADWDKQQGRKGGYYTWRIGRKPYSKQQIDFIAAYVIPEDSWFIIPLAKATGSAMMLPSRDAKRPSLYEPYREAWHLLGVDDNNLTIHASAVDQELLAFLKARIAESSR